MSNFGLTAQGFKPKLLSDILSDTNIALALVQDPVSGEFLNPVLDPLISQLSNVLLPGLAECWGAASDAANQFDPLKATGACLEGLVQLNGILAFPGSFSQVLMLLTGTGALEAGQQIASDDGNLIFTTDQDVAFNGGSATVSATCTTEGPNEPSPGSISNILTQSVQWNAAQNIATLNVGTFPESDFELRTRQQVETANTSYRQIEAIQAGIANVLGVIFCKVYQNKSATTVDAHGLPPKSICALVEGGQDLDVANAIFKKSAIGLDYFGASSVTLYDLQGFAYPILFQRPNFVLITAILNISMTDGSFPADGIAQITAAIVAATQFQGGNIGIPPATNVILSRLYTPINTIPGFQINSLLLSRDYNVAAAVNIDIAWNEAAQFVGSMNYFTADNAALCVDQAVGWLADAPSSSITISIT